MNHIETIARRILGWKLNRWDRWYDWENNEFIYEFDPENNLEHANWVVEKLKEYGFTFKKEQTENGDWLVCFNHFCEKGPTLEKAITACAYTIADGSSIPDEWFA